MYLFKFQAVAGEKKKVLEQGLWPINGYHLVVKPGQWIQIKFEQIPICCYQCGKLVMLIQIALPPIQVGQF